MVWGSIVEDSGVPVLRELGGGRGLLQVLLNGTSQADRVMPLGGVGASGPPPSSKRIAPPRFLPRSYPKLQDALLLALQPLLFLNDFKGE